MEAGSMLYNLYTYKGFDASYAGVAIWRKKKTNKIKTIS